jgi:uncharacterized protein YkwD
MLHRPPSATRWQSAVSILLFRICMRFVPGILLYIALLPGLRADEDASRILAEVNLARTDPRAYAGIVERTGRRSSALAEAVRFLKKASPRPPLEHSDALANSARSHVEDQGPQGAFGHTSRDGTGCFDRIGRYGRWIGAVGENIDYGGGGVRAAVVRLIIDEGVAGRKHRANIFSTNFRVAGMASGPHTRFGSMCVMNFAGAMIAR